MVKEYLDQQYQYDAYGQLVRQKSTQGDLNLEWDVYGRMIKSRNSQYTAEYRYDVLGRRIQKRSKHHHTGDEHNIIYGWDGDTLAYESTEQATKHYIYEKDSFVPMLQAVYQSPIELHQTPDRSDKPYSVHRDPLWKTTKQSKGFDDVWFYHCDHLGTPQEMTDHSGAIIWKAQYKAWGECQTEKAKSNFFENSEIISNNIRFQGQYFDLETGLHYNRYRYYSPYIGRFVSRDPIKILGSYNIYQYAPNPIEFVDPMGLEYREYFWKHVGDGHRDKYQVHHIIPQNIFNNKKYSKMLACAGMEKDGADNLIGLPRKQENAGLRTGRYFGQVQHNSSHGGYDDAIAFSLDAIGKIKDCKLRKAALHGMQETLRSALRRKQNTLMPKLGATADQWKEILTKFK